MSHCHDDGNLPADDQHSTLDAPSNPDFPNDFGLPGTPNGPGVPSLYGTPAGRGLASTPADHGLHDSTFSTPGDFGQQETLRASASASTPGVSGFPIKLSVSGSDNTAGSSGLFNSFGNPRTPSGASVFNNNPVVKSRPAPTSNTATFVSGSIMAGEIPAFMLFGLWYLFIAYNYAIKILPYNEKADKQRKKAAAKEDAKDNKSAKDSKSSTSTKSGKSGKK